MVFIVQMSVHRSKGEARYMTLTKLNMNVMQENIKFVICVL